MTEPISVAEAARYLRVDADDPDYSDLSARITAARMAVEQFLNASVVRRTRTRRLDAFPADGRIVLPNGPVASITSIGYVDEDGANQTVASYLLVADSERLRDVLTPAYGESWPTTRDQIGAVTITYVAGMMTGDSPSVLAEEDVRNAILLTLSDLWDNRSGAFVGTIHTINPTVERLLMPYRRALGV